MKNLKHPLFGALSAVLVMTASAVDVYVDGRNGSDTWDGSCAYADRVESAKKGPFKTFDVFRGKFNKVDGLTVYVAPDTYHSPQPFSYWGATWLNVTMIGTGTADDPVVFDGVSADGTSTNGCIRFNMSYRRVRLENFVFRNGRNSTGTSSGTAMPITMGDDILLSATNCVFESCHCSSGKDYHGGALALTSPNPVELVGCTFTNCSANGNGGAVYIANATDNVKIVNCSFTECASRQGTGGALFISWPNAELTEHGAVIENCGFTNNLAPHAGALASVIKLCTNTTFVGNRATGCGGAWFYDGYSGKHGNFWPMTNVFASCTFASNTAVQGGAVHWNQEKRFVFRDCAFVGNAGSAGAAVWGCGNQAVYDFTLDGCRVERNCGSGIFKASTGTSSTSEWGFRIRNCLFTDNDAGTEDLLCLTKTTTRMENCSFLRNIGKWVYEAGGSRGNTNYLANCLFACNTNRCSTETCGIISIEWQGVAPSSFYNLTFVSNAAPAAPYVIYQNHTFGPRVFANNVVYGNRSLEGADGDPLNSGYRNVAQYSFFETGTASVPAKRGNVLADDPKFVPGTFKPAPGSPIRRSGQVYDWMPGATDLDGAPRLNDNGTVSMGCYRFDAPGLLYFVK